MVTPSSISLISVALDENIGLYGGFQSNSKSLRTGLIGQILVISQ